MPPRLSLPSTILRELDIQQHPRSHQPHQRPSRRDQRREARVQKKQLKNPQLRRVTHRKSPQPLSVPKHVPARHGHSMVEDESYSEDGGDDDELVGGLQHVDDEDSEAEEGEDDMEGESEDDVDDLSGFHRPNISRSDQKKLSQDDKDIADLEKKLGLKRRSKLSKSFDEDGLGHLLEGLDGLGTDSESQSKTKRKSEAEQWLASKRRKADAEAGPVAGPDDEFGGFSDDASDAGQPQVSRRENPYVAPTTNVAKYVPPSLRRQSGGPDQTEAQLQRRIQGLINRLTTDNMTGLLKDVSGLYQRNPRQTVTSSLVRVLLMLVSAPEKRPDSFFVMVAGFVAAIHKTMGVAVSANFLQHQVEAINSCRSDASMKNLVALLAELYNMQVIACNLIFDYVRLFLKTQSELNTELLLRMIQSCGPALRRDDPRALGEIVGRLQSGSGKHVSVRTRFMMDEMKKLQSNKAKALARNKDLADQRMQLRKRISSLEGGHDTQPLRVSLGDIQGSEKQGKWWLVGASWVGSQPAANGGGPAEEDSDAETGDDFVGDDLEMPDLWKLAREQGFNTEVRQRIFVAIHGATDCESAHVLLQKLRLNKHQRKEIAEVVVRSGERQNAYNHYYALVMGKFNADKEMRFQLRRCLTTRFKKMGEDVSTDDGGDVEESDEEGVRWLYNTAKLYGFVVAGGLLTLGEVFRYRNLAALQERTRIFTEVLLVTVLQECKGDRLKNVFGGVEGDVEVSRGLQHFLRHSVRATDLANDRKTRKTVRRRCDEALELLDSLLAA